MSQLSEGCVFEAEETFTWHLRSFQVRSDWWKVNAVNAHQTEWYFRAAVTWGGSVGKGGEGMGRGAWSRNLNYFDCFMQMWHYFWLDSAGNVLFLFLSPATAEQQNNKIYCVATCKIPLPTARACGTFPEINSFFFPFFYFFF